MNIPCKKCGHLTISLDTLSDQVTLICSFCGTDNVTKPSIDELSLNDIKSRLKTLEGKVK